MKCIKLYIVREYVRHGAACDLWLANIMVVVVNLDTELGDPRNRPRRFEMCDIRKCAYIVSFKFYSHLAVYHLPAVAGR